ncbi:kelch-like protein 9 [Branchiostoma floridae]|uniref:Kelch-like protein 9 n=2 Tax=Branchiostoma floridae TaxID=7739 RepID=A0A9J7LQN7_BRAFL|nr:kelch-like protein 9 [Branchiostoma floridae]
MARLMARLFPGWPEATLSMPTNVTTMSSNLHLLRHGGVLCDVVLVAEGTSFPVHRAVLASGSDYFKVMFTCGMKESSQDVVDLNGISATGLRPLLDYIYTSSITLTSDNAEAVLHTAHQLQIDVMDFCSQFLCEEVDEENCFDMLALAEMYNLPNLLMAAGKAILEHKVDTEEFLCIDKPTLCKFLTHQELDLEEVEIAEAVIRWRRNMSLGSTSTADLFKHVRFPLIEEKELYGKVFATHFIRSNPVLEERVQEAIKYQENPFLQPAMQSEHTVPRRSVETVLAIGGRMQLDGKTKMEKCADVLGLEPRTGRWRIITELKWPQAVNSVCSVAAMGGFLYTVGGQNQFRQLAKRTTSGACRYDPRRDTWVKLASMNQERGSFVLLAHKGSLYAIGGYDIEGITTNTVEKYTPEKNEWSYVQPLPVERGGRADHAGVVCNNRIYVTGGIALATDSQDATFVYDHVHDTWERKASLNEARFGHGMVSVGGKILVLGGSITEPCGDMLDIYSIERYSPTSDEWATVSKMPYGRCFAGVTVFMDDIYVMGGFNRRKEATKKAVYIYHVEKDEWEEMEGLANRNMGVSAVTLRVPRRLLEKQLKTKTLLKAQVADSQKFWK